MPPHRCGPTAGPVLGFKLPTELTAGKPLPVPFHFGRCTSMQLRPRTVVQRVVDLSGVQSGCPLGSDVSLCTPRNQPSAGQEGQTARERSSAATVVMTKVACTKHRVISANAFVEKALQQKQFKSD